MPDFSINRKFAFYRIRTSVELMLMLLLLNVGKSQVFFWVHTTLDERKEMSKRKKGIIWSRNVKNRGDGLIKCDEVTRAHDVKDVVKSSVVDEVKGKSDLKGHDIIESILSVESEDDSSSGEDDDKPVPITTRKLPKVNLNLSSFDVVDDDEEDIFFEAGIILEVYMENFMNHRKFSLNLGKVVNFLTGQNGSGKSACVAAIQLCLGATASKTGRAPNLGKLIRHGSSGPAICRVKLLNIGVLGT